MSIIIRLHYINYYINFFVLIFIHLLAYTLMHALYTELFILYTDTDNELHKLIIP